MALRASLPIKSNKTMSLTLGDLLLPAPISTESARALAIVISGSQLKQRMEYLASHNQDLSSALQDAVLQVDVISAFLMHGVFSSGGVEPVSLSKVANACADAPRLDSNAFLATMQTLTRSVLERSLYHYPTMSFINSLRKRLVTYPTSEVSQLLLQVPQLLKRVCTASPEVEEHARSVMPLVEILIQRHPELNRHNAQVNRAFAVSAGREDVLPVVDDSEEGGVTGDRQSSYLHSPLCTEVTGYSLAHKEPGWLLYDKAEVQEALKSFEKQSAGPFGLGAQKSPREALLERMLASPAARNIVQQPAGAELFADLRTRFPHFAPVIGHLERHLALNGCGKAGAPVQFPPILLIGDPGIGKTFFGQYLADALKLYFIERDLSVVTDAMVLTGSSPTWKDSSPGVVFTALMNQGDANPLILLNEIDKCSDGRSHRNPLSSMYALLEKRSATSWADEFAGVSIDTSRVNWILTANDGYIPEPIMDRADTFHVRNPTKEESMQVAAFIWKDLVTTEFPSGNDFSTELPASVLEYGVTLPSRKLKKLLTSAAGNAVLANRTNLCVDDLKAVAKEDSEGTGRRVGFTRD